jgi:peptidoglycan hydrolase CwlO-like protein
MDDSPDPDCGPFRRERLVDPRFQCPRREYHAVSTATLRWIFGLLITAVLGAGAGVVHSIHDSGIKDQKIEETVAAIRDVQNQIGPVKMVPPMQEQLNKHDASIDRIKSDIGDVKGDLKAIKVTTDDLHEWMKNDRARANKP